MIYFDGAATTYPKPSVVKKSVIYAVDRLGGNPGRSGHKLSLNASAAVYGVREKAAAMFGAEPENVVFTSNCTHSLNTAVKGYLMPFLKDNKDVHVIISSMEHNSVLRPVHELSKHGLKYSIAQVYADDMETVESFDMLIRPTTKAIICTLGSNVTGRLMPYSRIGELCRRKGICFIGDGAQVCGVVPIDMKRDNINILCMPGHKGLYGISGTGLLITDGKYPVYHIMEGGTGSTSEDAEQTPFLPERLESGTVNTVGIVSVGAGIDFINSVGMDKIHSHENMLCEQFISKLKDAKGVKIYREERGTYLPIVLFNLDELTSEQTASILSDKGFALRGGLHCSPLAHKTTGTFPEGGVRFAPSCFNTAGQTDALVSAVRSITPTDYQY